MAQATRTAPVIVVASNKGGVGRTVTAVNLAAMLALSGRRTLLVDLDPKGDATAGVGLTRDSSSWRGLERIQDPKLFLSDCATVARPQSLEVWRGGPALEELQAELWREEDPPTHLLDQGLALARERYRAIVIDAPPALDPLGCNALAAANVLILPLSSRSAFSESALEETLAMARELCLRPLRVLGVRVAARRGEALDPGLEERPSGRLDGSGTLDCAIAYDADTLMAATERGLPVFEHAPDSRVARSFLELGREVIEKVLESDL